MGGWWSQTRTMGELKGLREEGRVFTIARDEGE